jgi:hypothetical protein
MFLGVFKVKKIPNLNSPHYTKYFDTKILHFGSLNLFQRQLFFSKSESSDPFSLLHQKKRKRKNKIWYQNVFFENCRDLIT